MQTEQVPDRVIVHAQQDGWTEVELCWGEAHKQTVRMTDQEFWENVRWNQQKVEFGPNFAPQGGFVQWKRPIEPQSAAKAAEPTKMGGEGWRETYDSAGATKGWRSCTTY